LTVEFFRENGTSVTSMPMELDPSAVLHFDDVVSGLFGEHGKGWLVVSGSGSGLFATSRTFNDDPEGTYGQLIPAYPDNAYVGMSENAVLPGLSSAAGFRTNLGFTSLAAVQTIVTVEAYTNDGTSIGSIDIELPAYGFVQLERALAEEFGFIGTAWAEVRNDDPRARYFAHASVVDETTGDPTYIPAMLVAVGP